MTIIYETITYNYNLISYFTSLLPCKYLYQCDTYIKMNSTCSNYKINGTLCEENRVKEKIEMLQRR